MATQGCKDCGAEIRLVELDTGERVVIDANITWLTGEGRIHITDWTTNPPKAVRVVAGPDFRLPVEHALICRQHPQQL